MIEAKKQKNSQIELAEQAVALMERALILLDEAGLNLSASHLEQAICFVPDADGRTPRYRTSQV
jgi:hypothetical protein